MGLPHVRTSRYLPAPWLVALVVGLMFVVVLGGSLVQDVEEPARWAVWSLVWGGITILSCAVVFRYANPSIPTVFGVLVGLTAPRPSEEWLRQVAGLRWASSIDLLTSIIYVAVALTAFKRIAKRHPPWADRHFG